jgi:hypothetical protein
MPQICNMRPTVLLPLRRKACWGFFHPEISDGFGRVRTRGLGYQVPACYFSTTEAAKETLLTVYLLLSIKCLNEDFVIQKWYMS